HHVNALERAGILKLAHTRQVRGTTEKYFEVARKYFGAEEGTHITAGMKGSLRSLAQVVFGEARDDLIAALSDSADLTEDTAPIAMRVMLTVSAAEIAAIRQKIMSLVQSIQKEHKRNPPAADALRWALTVAFAPRWKPTQE